MMLLEDAIITLIISLSAMTPIALVAIGEIIAEKSGVVNIGLEGILLLSAWLGAYAAIETNSILAGYLAGLLMGLILGTIHGIISVNLKGDQIIAGVGVNMIAAGLTTILTKAVWGNYGQSPPINLHPPGFILMGQRVSYAFFLALIVGITVWYVLDRTTMGLKIKAVGDDPKSAEALGISVTRTRLIATIIGGGLAGIAGAFLSVDYVGSFVKLMSAGRGFIALADVAFSGWHPLFALFGAFVFGFSDALARYYTIIKGTTAGAYLINTIPYMVTLLAITVTAKRAIAPRALGRPYVKE